MGRREIMAKRYPCPHCSHPTIPLWRRLCLGPAWPTTCTGCERRVGVPWSSMWLGSVFALVGAAFGMLLGPARGSMGGASRVLATGLLLGLTGLLGVAWIR